MQRQVWMYSTKAENFNCVGHNTGNNYSKDRSGYLSASQGDTRDGLHESDSAEELGDDHNAANEHSEELELVHQFLLSDFVRIHKHGRPG